MKKVIQIVTAVVVSVGFVGSVASAQVAAETCTTVISNSGDGNTTVVECNTEKIVTVTCVNNLVVGNYNVQEGESGSGSSTGGSVASGTVVNYNNTQTTIGAACGASATTSPSPSPSPSTSVTPTPTPSTKPKVLPNTATNDTASIVASSLVAAVGVVALSRVAVAAYRRIGNK